MSSETPKYVILIKDTAVIPFRGGSLKTPANIFVKTDFELMELKTILKNKGIKNFIIEEYGKTVNKNITGKKETVFKLKSKVPPRPSSYNKK